MIHVKMAIISHVAYSKHKLHHSLNLITQYTQSNKHPNNRCTKILRSQSFNPLKGGE